MKIKNIVFDLGGVLVDFNPRKLLQHIGFNTEDVELLNKIIFYGEEWKDYNSSLYDVNETRNKILKHYPEHSDKINIVFDKLDFNYVLFLKENTPEYLKSLSDRGYNIYVLSDLSEDTLSYNQAFWFYEYVLGGVYSFEVGSTKPNRKNYEELLNRFNLKAEETIFIDDRLDNAEKACELGIKGIQFTTLDEVKDKVEKIL